MTKMKLTLMVTTTTVAFVIVVVNMVLEMSVMIVAKNDDTRTGR